MNVRWVGKGAWAVGDGKGSGGGNGVGLLVVDKLSGTWADGGQLADDLGVGDVGVGLVGWAVVAWAIVAWAVVAWAVVAWAVVAGSDDWGADAGEEESSGETHFDWFEATLFEGRCLLFRRVVKECNWY